MLTLIVYDIPNNKRRTHLANLLEGYGRRVQKSVFECFLTPTDLQKLYTQVCRKVHPTEDSVRFYWIPAGAVPKTLTIGGPPPTPPPAAYIL